MKGKLLLDKRIWKNLSLVFIKKIGQPEISNIKMRPEGIQKIDPGIACQLTEPFSLAEIKSVVFGMAQNKSAGPDGFPIEFCQLFWDTIKIDLLALVNDFQQGKLEISRLNYGIITLIPKCKDTTDIKKFRPICLLNVSFKIITKPLMSRLSSAVDPVVGPTQTAFLKNRYIMEGVLI